MKWVCVHGCFHSPFLVNGLWTRYLRQHPIEFHNLPGRKLTLCLVLIVRARKMGQCPNLVVPFENGKLNYVSGESSVIFLVTHMDPSVKACKSVGRFAKPAVGPRKIRHP